MEDKKKLLEPQGSGVDPIPGPGSRTAAREGSTAMIEDAVKGFMDNIEESLTGKPNTDGNNQGKSAE